MGCGQSKIGIYQRRSKNKKNASKRSAESGESDEETEEGEKTIIKTDIKNVGCNNKDETENDSVTAKIKQIAQQQTDEAMLVQSDISSSQLDFFKMLDEKIENGPDYEESDEEEQKARLANLIEEWKTACSARQQKKDNGTEEENWSSSGPEAKYYQENIDNYVGRRISSVDTQRFPTGYSPCPPNSSISIHVPNSIRNSTAYGDPSRVLPSRMPILGNYHPYQPPSESYNNCDTGHSLSMSEPINPMRANYSQILLRPSPITSQLHHYPENQRLYPENIRQFSDFCRSYQDHRSYQIPRAVPNLNILHDQRKYGQDLSGRPILIFQDEVRQSEDVQRIIADIPRQYYDSQRPENVRPQFGNIDNQRLYHKRLNEKQRSYIDDARTEDHSRVPNTRPAMLSQSLMCRDIEISDTDINSFTRQDRFPDAAQDSTCRMYNPGHFKGGRPVGVDVQYVAGPPSPREMIPLQGAPGPPQGSPKPIVAKNLQRLPANVVGHFRKPQGAFT